MRQISLISMTLENFKSFRSATWTPSAAPGFKFLGGDNKTEPRLGANGAGKSSLLDALFWCLYGVGVRGQRASELVRWGEKRPYVAVLLDIDYGGWTIERTGSPEKLLVGGEPATQQEVDALLGLTQAQFRHAVLFGQNVPFFADLPIPQRGALLEEVLELDAWNHAAEAASAAYALAGEALHALGVEKARKEGALGALPDEQELKRAAQEWEQARASELAVAEEEAATAVVEFTAAQTALKKARKALDGPLAEEAAAARQLLRAREKAAKETEQGCSKDAVRVAQARKELRRLEHAETCPTCGQEWPQQERAAELASARKKLLVEEQTAKQTAVYRDFAADALEEARKQTEELLARVAAAEAKVAGLEATAAAEQRRWDRASAQVEKLSQPKKNPWRAKVRERNAQEASLREELAALVEKVTAAEGERELAQFWRGGFKRVRLFMIRRVLQHLEIEVEAAVASLGLVGWSIRFATETETKSGTAKQGVQIIVTSPTASASWESWSGGEGQRLRMAVSLGLASMLQRVSGVRYTFELWDEPSAWLSEQGIEDLLATLRQRAEVEQRSLWLVDHRAIHQTAFDEIWVVSKTADGSRAAQI